MSLSNIIVASGCECSNRADINVKSLMIGNGCINKGNVIQVKSTTQGIGLPVMSSTQKLAIVDPAKGTILYDESLGKICLFDGQDWVAL